MDTKRMITEGFVKLLNKNSFDNITTQMIVEASGVSRSTFYRHFKDKYEVMTYYYQKSVEEVRSNYPFSEYKAFLMDFLSFVKNNYAYFSKVIKTTGDNSFFVFLSTYVAEYYEFIYRSELERKEISTKESYQITIITEGCNEAVRRYILSGCKDDEKQIAESVIGILPDELKAIIK